MKNILATKDEYEKVKNIILENKKLYKKVLKYLDLFDLKPIYTITEKKGIKVILKILNNKERTKTSFNLESEARQEVTLEFYKRFFKEFFELFENNCQKLEKKNIFTDYSIKKVIEFPENKLDEFFDLFSINKKKIELLRNKEIDMAFFSKIELYYKINLKGIKNMFDVNKLIENLENKVNNSKSILEEIIIKKNNSNDFALFYREILEKIKNNGTIQNIIGEIYEDKLINLEIAYEFYEKSSENGNFRAKLNLARWYEQGIFVKKNILKSINIYEILAKSDNIQAMYRLGFIFDLGKEVKQNLFKAEEYYKKLIVLNHREATYNLAMIYMTKYQDKTEDALKLLKKAVDLGHFESYFALGNFYERKCDYKKAYEYYKIGSEKNNGRSFFGLGILYEKGYGVDQNLLKAKDYYNKAYEYGYENARNFLNKLGENKPYDIEKLKKLSIVGDLDSKNLLAKLYYESKEYSKAKMYALEAVTLGSSDSIWILGKIEEDNNNIKQAQIYYEMGKNKNNYFCMVAEAWLYFKLKNWKKAEECYLNILNLFNKNNNFIYKILIRIYSNKKEFNKIEKYYNLVDKESLNADIYRIYGYSKFKNKEYVETIKIYKNILKEFPLNASEYKILAECYLKQEDYENSLNFINIALELKSDDFNFQDFKNKILKNQEEKNIFRISSDDIFLEKVTNSIIETTENIESSRYKLLSEKEGLKRIHKDMIFCALGGGNEIGASCYFIQVDKLKFIIDCGYRIKKNKNEEYYPKINTLYENNLLTSKNDLTAILLTHGHLDHIGSLISIKEEFKNTPIYSSGATKDLTYFLLNEINLTENSEFYDSEYNLKKYEQLLLENTISSIYAKKINEEIKGENYSIKFYEAGHILGARMILINIDGFKILITGDFSEFEQSLIPKYNLPENLKVDILITESTHFKETNSSTREEEIKKLFDLINDKLNTGNILIPSFSIGRAQEIASILNNAINAKLIEKMPIYIDGTAKIVSKIYEKHGFKIFNEIVKEAPSNLIYNFEKEKSIIISSSGMLLDNCKASRYVEKMITKPNNSIIFTGYLSPNSKGYKLLKSYNEEIEKITINEKKYQLNAKISKIGLGAHVSQNGIEELIEKVSPKTVILVHNNAILKHENLYDKLRLKYSNIEILQSYNKLVTYL